MERSADGGARARVGAAVGSATFGLEAFEAAGIPFDAIGGGGSCGHAVHDFVWHFAAIVGVWIGGGTSPCGIGSTHGFVMRRLPDQFTLRFPAADDGPPLLEVDVAARR